MVRKTITLHGFSSTPTIDSWVEKIEAALEKQIDPSDTSAILDIDIRHLAHYSTGKGYSVEATLSARKISIHAQSENENLLSAIEIVRDEIVDELSSRKKRREHFVRRGGRAFKDFVRGLYK